MASYFSWPRLLIPFHIFHLKIEKKIFIKISLNNIYFTFILGNYFLLPLYRRSTISIEFLKKIVRFSKEEPFFKKYFIFFTLKNTKNQIVFEEKQKRFECLK